MESNWGKNKLNCRTSRLVTTYNLKSGTMARGQLEYWCTTIYSTSCQCRLQWYHKKLDLKKTRRWVSSCSQECWGAIGCHWYGLQPVGVLLADGHAICPDCGTCVNCGTVGITNRSEKSQGCHRRTCHGAVSWWQHEFSTVECMNIEWLTKIIHQNDMQNDAESSVAIRVPITESVLEERFTTLTLTTESLSEINDLPTKRKRVRRAVELNGCFCGSVLSSSMAGVIECKRTGCETQWVSTSSRTYYWVSCCISYLSVVILILMVSQSCD